MKNFDSTFERIIPFFGLGILIIFLLFKFIPTTIDAIENRHAQFSPNQLYGTWVTTSAQERGHEFGGDAKEHNIKKNLTSSEFFFIKMTIDEDSIKMVLHPYPHTIDTYTLKVKYSLKNDNELFLGDNDGVSLVPTKEENTDFVHRNYFEPSIIEIMRVNNKKMVLKYSYHEFGSTWIIYTMKKI
ncbi:MAG: hypothetical protein IJP72_03835 [Bacteroidales bacterium]|nr:hypothetical protein [Bacteroidales bacterium]